MSTARKLCKTQKGYICVKTPARVSTSWLHWPTCTQEGSCASVQSEVVWWISDGTRLPYRTFPCWNVPLIETNWETQGGRRTNISVPARHGVPGVSRSGDVFTKGWLGVQSVCKKRLRTNPRKNHTAMKLTTRCADPKNGARAFGVECMEKNQVKTYLTKNSFRDGTTGSGGTSRFDRPRGYLQIRQPPLECRPHDRSDRRRFLVLLAPLHSSAAVAVLLVAGRRRGSPFPPPDGLCGLCTGAELHPSTFLSRQGNTHRWPSAEASDQ